MGEESKQQTRELEDAFRLFNQVSEKLTDTYHVLEQRVSELNAELSAAHSERLQELAEKERLANRLQHLLEALPGGVVVLDGQDVLQECNPAARDLLGEPLLGLSWDAIAARTFTNASSDTGDQVLHDGRQVNIVTRRLGTEPGRILLLNDVTETRALNERLNRHRRLSAMGEMAARLAHQIRTPLTSAMLYVSHLMRPVLDADKHRRFVRKTQSSLRHLETLVNDMLMFAKGGSVGNELIHVTDLIQAFKQALEPLMLEHDCELEIIDTTESLTLHGNRDALLGALQNLAINAMQAIGKGGGLQLQGHLANDDILELVLKDNGPGMSREQLEHIFEPFYTTKSHGTGLGLAVVQAIVRAHNGSVSVDSHPGQGSSFALRLPAISDKQETSAKLDSIVDESALKENVI